MKRQNKRIIAVVLAAVLLLCTGCSLDVEQFLRPPKTHGEQQAVQKALETYLQDSGQSSRRYTLRYPVEGEHTAAFILCDASGRPERDDLSKATLAVAFYSTDSAPNDTHINLLRRQGNEWVSIADTVGGSSAILQAAFGDLDGDGMAELMTGWDAYSGRDRRLDVFSLANGLTMISGSRRYTRMFTGTMTADGRDSLVMLRMENASVYATLSYVSDSTLYDSNQVYLDSGIQQVVGMQMGRLNNDAYGLYVDAVKDNNTLITELLYVDDGTLYAPFCQQASRLNSGTARPLDFTMRDVDGDGQIEIPQCQVLDGYDAEAALPDYAYRADWMSWGIDAGWAVDTGTIINAADGYFITLDDVANSRFTTVYDADSRTLTLKNTESGKALLRLRPVSKNHDDEYVVLYEADDYSVGCEAWFDSTYLDLNSVRYMVAQWEE